MHFFLFPLCLFPAFAQVGGYSGLLDKYRSAVLSQFTSMDPQRYNVSSERFTPRQDAFSLQAVLSCPGLERSLGLPSWESATGVQTR